MGYLQGMGKKVLLIGATGFVGAGLAELLADEGWEVVGVSRKGTGHVKGVSSWFQVEAMDLSTVDAVVNLAGEAVDQRWTDEKKWKFHESRVGLTERLVEKLKALPAEKRPAVLINASAVGFYGGRGDELLKDDATRGHGYLADLCAAWETAAMSAEALGVRVACFRIGIVLGKEGRAFQKLKMVFKLGIGGNLGNGRQWMPWIHVEDLRRAIAFSMSQQTIRGGVNGTAPHPERNADFTKKMAKASKRWVFLPVPEFALKLALGEFATVLLASQNTVPAKLTEAGFVFQYAHLEDALKNLVG